MSRCQLLLHRLAACHHDAVELEIAHRRGALGFLQKSRQQFIRDLTVSIFADAFSLIDAIHSFDKRVRFTCLVSYLCKVMENNLKK